MSKRTLTVQDIMLMQKQLEAAEQLNNILGQAVAEIGDAVSGIESASVQDKKVAAALDKIKSAVNKLEKEVEEFTIGLK
ncbi:MAG: hypothetical protein V3W52_16380 [Syntrophobacteria bacterium]|jgi:hypothetical protein